MSLTAVARMTPWDRIAAWYRNSVFYELFRYLNETVFGVRLGDYDNLSFGSGAESTLRNLILALMAGALVAAAASVYAKAVPGGFVRRLLRMGATDPDHAVTLYASGYFRSFGVRRDLRRGGSLAKLVCRVGDGGLTVAGTDPAAAPQPPEAETASDSRPSLVDRLTSDLRSPASESAVRVSKINAPDAPTASAGDSSPDAVSPSDPRPLKFASDRFYIPEALRVRAELRYDKDGSGVRTFLLAAALTVAAAILICRFLPALFSLADGIMSMF